MWGLNRFQRPAWSTGILIPGSFLCGILAAVLIWHGGKKTKRLEEVEERLRAALGDETPPDWETNAEGRRVLVSKRSEIGDGGGSGSAYTNGNTYEEGKEENLAHGEATEQIQDVDKVDEHMTVPSSNSLNGGGYPEKSTSSNSKSGSTSELQP